MLKFLRMGRTAQNRSFNYIPRYYDERKERLDAILDRGRDKGDPESIKARISAANSRARSDRRGGMSHRQQSRSQFVRVLLILLALTTIAYYLVGIYLPSLAAYLE